MYRWKNRKVVYIVSSILRVDWQFRIKDVWFSPTLKCNCDFTLIFLTLWFLFKYSPDCDFAPGLCISVPVLTVD
jgi:hypothetical protein